MFADTITITINAVAKVLARINSGDPYSSEYLLRETTGEFRLKIRNSSYTDKLRGTVDRHNIEFVETIFAVAPATINRVRKIYAVFENEQADDQTASKKFAAGFAGFLTEANFLKLLNWES